ncbi:MAG: hypothetical protein IKT70_02090 [Clostridia bacterium]|nr:hypothetical protein [Clostridia bacterium]
MGENPVRRSSAEKRKDADAESDRAIKDKIKATESIRNGIMVSEEI